MNMQIPATQPTVHLVGVTGTEDTTKCSVSMPGPVVLKESTGTHINTGNTIDISSSEPACTNMELDEFKVAAANECMVKISVASHKSPSRVALPSFSAKYLSDRARFSRSLSNDILYDNMPVCRYFSTQRGCRAGTRCRFLHKRLGCVFFQQAKQGCVYSDSEQCPFSHDPDTVVMASALVDCASTDCNRSCMHAGSTCLLCFNRVNRERRERVRVEQKERRAAFNHIYTARNPQQMLTQPYVPVSWQQQNPQHSSVPTQHSYFVSS